MSSVTDLRAFVRVVERGGFAAASKDLQITPSAVAKLISPWKTDLASVYCIARLGA
jgi:DNA-binding transcriptional LysR family regulator